MIIILIFWYNGRRWQYRCFGVVVVGEGVVELCNLHDWRWVAECDRKHQKANKECRGNEIVWGRYSIDPKEQGKIAIQRKNKINQCIEKWIILRRKWSRYPHSKRQEKNLKTLVKIWLPLLRNRQMPTHLKRRPRPRRSNHQDDALRNTNIIHESIP